MTDDVPLIFLFFENNVSSRLKRAFYVPFVLVVFYRRIRPTVLQTKQMLRGFDRSFQESTRKLSVLSAHFVR